MLSAETQIVASADQVSCEMDDDVMILNLKDGEYYELGQVGAHIWDAIQKPCSLEQLEQSLLDRYEVDLETARADLSELIGNLLDKGLVSVHA